MFRYQNLKMKIIATVVFGKNTSVVHTGKFNARFNTRSLPKTLLLFFSLYHSNHRLSTCKPSVYIDSQLSGVLITQFLIYRTLATLLQRCVLCTFYLPVLKTFMYLLGFEHRTFIL